MILQVVSSHGFHGESFACISHFPICATCPIHTIPLNFITLIFDELCKLCNSFQFSVTSSLLGPHILHTLSSWETMIKYDFGYYQLGLIFSLRHPDLYCGILRARLVPFTSQVITVNCYKNNEDFSSYWLVV